MGLSFRKSKKLFGGVRLNISTRGIGVSGGVKGFRISTGPRGLNLSAGVGGLRYQKKLSGAGNATGSQKATQQQCSGSHLFRPFNAPAFTLWLVSFITFGVGLSANGGGIIAFSFLLWGVSVFAWFKGNKSVQGYKMHSKAIKLPDDDPGRERLLKEAVVLYPHNSIKEDLAFFYWRNEKFNEALVVLNDLSGSRSPDIIVATGHCLMKVGKGQDALEFLCRVDEADEYDGFMDVLLLKAECFFEMKEYDKALMTVKTGLAKRSEKYADQKRIFRLWQARIEHATGNTKKAVGTLNKLLAEAPNFEEANEMLNTITAA